MKHRGQDAPSYSKAQVTAWLAWLARGMQQHGQTLFLIEQLQPSWLGTQGQRWIYFLTSRILWGIVGGLTFGLIIGLIFYPIFGMIAGLRYVEPVVGTIVGVIFGLVVGLVDGLALGLMDGVRFAGGRTGSTQSGFATSSHTIGNILLAVVIGGLSGGLIVRLSSGMILQMSQMLKESPLYMGMMLLPSAWPVFGLTFGLIAGLMGGLFWVLRSLGRNPGNEIRTVETLRFSLSHLFQGIVVGLMAGLMVRLIFGLMFQQVGGQMTGGLRQALRYGLFFGTVFGLMTSLRPGIRELKTIPNQGIRLSLRTADLVGGVAGLSLGLITGITSGWTSGFVVAVFGGLSIGLWYGGLDVIQHYIVRILLWRAGAMPWDYARFLDYAAEELTFLQRVGGGYIFVHRYLLEYFAAMDLPGQAVAADGAPVSQPAITPGESV